MMDNNEMVMRARNVHRFLKQQKVPPGILHDFKRMMDELQYQINTPRDAVWENNSRLWQPEFGEDEYLEN